MRWRARWAAVGAVVATAAGVGLWYTLGRPAAPAETAAEELPPLPPRGDEPPPGDPVASLIWLVRDDDPKVRQKAAETLGRVGPRAAAAVPALVEVIRRPPPPPREGDMWAGFHSEWPAQAAAAQALGKVGPAARAAVPDLIRALTDPAKGQVAAGAAEGLGGIGPDARPAVPHLLAVVHAHRERQFPREATAIRRGPGVMTPHHALEAAVVALGRIGPGAAEAVPTLVALLPDADFIIRRAAIEALGQIGPAAELAVPALVQLLVGDESAGEGWRSFGDTARRAGDALVRIGPAAVPALVEQAEVWGWKRFGPLGAVARLGPPARAAVPALVALLPRAAALPRAAVREEYERVLLATLGELGPDAAQPLLAYLDARPARDTWPDRGADEAAEALRRIALTAPDAVPLVHVTRASPTLRVLRPGPAAAPALTELLAHPSDRVRGMATVALADAVRPALTDQATPPPDAPWSGPTVRELVERLRRPGAAGDDTWQAVRSLGQIGRSLGQIGPGAAEAVPALVELLGRPDLDHSDRLIELAEALGWIGPAAGSAAPRLTALLGHDLAEVRWAAFEALDRIAR